MVSSHRYDMCFALTHSLCRYNEAIVLCKAPQDVAWHASALEGLATIPIVEAWSSTHGIVRMLRGSRVTPLADRSSRMAQPTTRIRGQMSLTRSLRPLPYISVLYQPLNQRPLFPFLPIFIALRSCDIVPSSIPSGHPKVGVPLPSLRCSNLVHHHSYPLHCPTTPAQPLAQAQGTHTLLLNG